MTGFNKGEKFICCRCGIKSTVSNNVEDDIPNLEILMNREIRKEDLLLVCDNCFQILKDNYERTGRYWC